MAPTKRIELFGDWILAKPYVVTKEESQAQRAGIVLTAESQAELQKNRADKAIVLEIGPEVQKVSVGKKIAFLRFSQQEIEFDEDKFILLREIELVGWIP